MTFGRTYVDVHWEKDAASKVLGIEHREVNHEWYTLCGREWTLENPFPPAMHDFFEYLERSALSDDEAEALQAWAAHDVLDRVWDSLGDRQRMRIEALCYWLLSSPEVLKRAYGVDVVTGRIQRVIDGQERWENVPAVLEEYQTLKAYADAVAKNNRLSFTLSTTRLLRSRKTHHDAQRDNRGLLLFLEKEPVG